MKKILTVGVGAFFLTEESFRTFVSDFKLPKELLAAVMESAGKTKEEFFKNLSKEIMGQVMSRVKMNELVQETLEKNEIDFHVTVNFSPKKKHRKL